MTDSGSSQAVGSHNYLQLFRERVKTMADFDSSQAVGSHVYSYSGVWWWRWQVFVPIMQSDHMCTAIQGASGLIACSPRLVWTTKKTEFRCARAASPMSEWRNTECSKIRSRLSFCSSVQPCRFRKLGEGWPMVGPDPFCIALLSAFEQTHYSVVICDSEWITVSLQSTFFFFFFFF